MTSYHEFVQDNSHGIYIAQWVSLVIEFGQFLWGNIVQSPFPSVSKFVALVKYRQAEVCKLVGSTIDEHVLRFEVLV